jgi:hypothetical protein
MSELRRHAIGDRGLWNPLERLLAREIRVDAVLEVHRDRREAVERDRAQRVERWDAVHLDLERDSDEALDVLGVVAGPLRDDLGARRREVGIRVDGQALKRQDAPHRDHEHADNHDGALRQGE